MDITKSSDGAISAKVVTLGDRLAHIKKRLDDIEDRLGLRRQAAVSNSLSTVQAVAPYVPNLVNNVEAALVVADEIESSVAHLDASL